MVERRWTIRVCKECGSHHGRLHDGCVTHSSPMFPQVTKWAGVNEVEVMPVSEHEEALARAYGEQIIEGQEGSGSMVERDPRGVLGAGAGSDVGQRQSEAVEI